MNDEKREELYYTRADVRRLANVSDTTLDRWSRILRGTPMVVKVKGRVLFTKDFVDFVATRVDSQGPPNLPEPERIATLLRLWREESGDLDAVASALGEPPLLVEAQLMEVLGERYDRESD
jgi:hypothetical protein